MLCPSDSVLERFAADQLPSLLEQRLVEHMESCPACRTRAGDVYKRRQPQPVTRTSETGTVDSDGATLLEPEDLHADLYHLITGDVMQTSLASERTKVLFRLLAAAPDDDVAGMTLGRFTVKRWLGAGGFGVVFLAYDNLLRREIALKLPRAQALVQREMRKRFLREAEAAAKLHHPNIVPVFEAGVEQGVCYIASEYCPGPTLDAWFAEQKKPISVHTAAEIVRQIAGAVDHAHQHQVLHRDIKPSNILLDLGVADPWRMIPKITDFGLAKMLDNDASMTANQGLLGTPRYMSPEQAAGDRSVTGPATDVFALGAVLYELLTGVAPYAGHDHAQTLHRLFFDQVVPPRRTRPDIPRDLEAICLKCLEKKREDRYPTAQQLADDLQRFETGQTTHARPLTRLETLRRWTIRQPLTASLLALIGLGLLSLLGVLMIHSRSLQSFNKEIQTALQATQQAQQTAEKQRTRLRNLLYVSKMNLAHQAIRERDLRQASKLLQEVSVEAPDTTTNFVTRYLRNQVSAQGREIDRAADDIYDLQFSPSGARLAACGADAMLRLYDGTSLTPQLSISTQHGEMNGISFSPDEQMIATAGDDGRVRLWDTTTLALRRTIETPGKLTFAAIFTADGNILITCGDDPVIRLWDVQTGEPQGTLPGHTRSVEAISISPDGALLASASSDQTARVWDLASRQTRHVLQGHTGRVVDVQFSAGGDYLLTGSVDHTIRAWRVLDGRCLQLESHLDQVAAVAFLGGDSILVAGDRGGSVHAWQRTQSSLSHESARSPKTKPLHSWKAHAGRVWVVTPARDGTALLTAGADGHVVYWKRPPAVQDSLPIAPGHEVTDIALESDAARLYFNDSIRGVQTWDLASGQVRDAIDTSDTTGRRSVALCMLPQRMLAVGYSDGAVEARKLSTGQLESSFKLPWGTISRHGLCASRQARRLAAFSYHHNAALVYDLADPDSHQVFQAYAHCMAISNDGKRLAMSDGNHVIVWDIDDRKAIARLQGHTNSVSSLAFSPDGRRLASGSADRQVRLWNLQNQTSLSLRGHRGELLAVAFSPDGSLLVSGDDRGELKFWFLAEATDLISIDGDDPIQKLNFSDDGNRLAVLSAKRIRVFNATPTGFEHARRVEPD